jgi:Protein of unknown function (DUF3800)
MHLIYLDESGNTGTNLKDPQQPVFVLAALIVPETCWQQLEAELESALRRSIPAASVNEIEVHCGDLRSGRGNFKGIELNIRIALRNEWLAIAKNHGLKVVYRAIAKRKFERWMHHTFGAGVTINPYVAAFPLVARVVDEYLCGLPAKALGMFIADENKEIVHDIEKSIKVLRGVAGSLRLAQIVEKGFFIDSKKSRVLQLCDLCALCARKKEEVAEGIALKGFDLDGVKSFDPLIHRGNELMVDVLAWLTGQLSQNTEKK